MSIPDTTVNAAADATTATEPLEIPRRETRAALVGAQPHGWLEEDVALLVRPGP